MQQLKETLIKFSDLLIATTAAAHDELCFWEPRTLAPYEPLIVIPLFVKACIQDRKFYAAPNTLCVSASSHVVAAHSQKTTANVWRWDKKEPLLRFPLREELAVLKMSNAYSGALCIGGTKSGKLMIWQTTTGQLLGELEAHYLGVTDLDISSNGDLLITGGKDSKVKVYILAQ